MEGNLLLFPSIVYKNFLLIFVATSSLVHFVLYWLQQFKRTIFIDFCFMFCWYFFFFFSFFPFVLFCFTMWLNIIYNIRVVFRCLFSLLHFYFLLWMNLNESAKETEKEAAGHYVCVCICVAFFCWSFSSFFFLKFCFYLSSFAKEK